MLSRRLFAATAAGAAAAAGASAVLAAEARAQTAPPQTAPTESTMDRMKSTKVLRIAALPGEAPYFNKDLATGAWSGMCIDMAKDIAGNFDGTVEYVESTYGNSVLDLQANKIDLAFALNPTPKRALVIDFTHPFYLHGFGMVGAKGFKATNWADLDKPEVKIAFDIGSVHEIAARRFASHAQHIALKTRDECVLAVQSGRADCVIMAVHLGLTAVKKNPANSRCCTSRASNCRPAWVCARKPTRIGAISSMPGSITTAASSRSANGSMRGSRSTASSPRTSRLMSNYRRCPRRPTPGISRFCGAIAG
jgi:ABC-type amino acid transport substrate-binding protein